MCFTRVSSVVAALLFASACGGGKDADAGPGATVSFGTTTVTESRDLDTQGGTLTGAPGTPIAGVQVAFPSGAFQNQTKVSIGHNSGTVTPAAGTWGGMLLDITTDYGLPFEEPVRVTVPFNPDPATVPVPYYVTPDGQLEVAQTIAIDREAGTFSFDTWHASSYTYMNALLIDPTDDTYDTGFDPKEDGFQIKNNGSKYSREGECMGMDAFALWYFKTQRKSGDRFYPRFMEEVSPGIKGQDIIATRAFTSISRVWDSYLPGIEKQKKQTNAENYAGIKNALRNTKGPVLLTLAKPLLDEKARNHDVLAYAYLKGKLFLYDSNQPNRTIEHEFDGERFAPYDPIASYEQTWLTGDGSLSLAEPYLEIYLDALAKFKSQDATITVDSHQPDAHVTDRVITLTGTVLSGEVLVEEIRVYVDRSTVTAPVATGTGAFSVQVPLKKGENWLNIRTYGRNSNNRLVPVKNTNDNTKGLLINCDAEATTMLVTLSWDQSVDLDLYVTDPTGKSAWFLNKTTDDGGDLDVDNTRGFGPEHFTLTISDTTRFDQPYLIKIHKYTGGDQFTKWKLSVKLNEGDPVTHEGVLTSGDSANKDPGSTGSDWGGFITVTPKAP